MANVTLSLDDDVLKKAKKYAAERGTTLNAMVREHLEELLDESGSRKLAQERINHILSTLKLKKARISWTREDLNER